MHLKVKRLHILLLRSFAGPFAMTFMIVIFIMVMQFLFKYIDELVGKGLEFLIISEFVIYLTASMVPMALPLAILMAALMTFGDLGEFYELTAMKSSGISLIRIMMPLIILIVFMSFGAFAFSNYVLPVANLKMRSLLYDIQRKRPAFNIAEGIFYNGIEGFSMRIDTKDPTTNMMYGIRIYDHTDRKGNNMVTIADSGFMKVSSDDTYLVFTMYSGRSYNEIESDRKNKQDFTFPHRRDLFQEQEILIELTGFGLDRTDESLFKSHNSMMSLGMLEHYEDSFKTEIDKVYKGLNASLTSRTYYNYRRVISPPNRTEEKADEFTLFRLNVDSLFNELAQREKEQRITSATAQARASMNFISTSESNSSSKVARLRRYQIEIHRKFTLSFACLIFFFIGAPLGAIIRKGGLGMPTVISVLFFLIWYIISMTGEQFARDSALNPLFGMWLSSAILLPIGIWLTYKSMTDSSLMNMETYSSFFRRIRRRIRYMRIKLGILK
ncbi:MAG TPA: YjgP/YjgQ family permease [Bacteroides sp.]|nr:YjgP/YjgQ family permease [Bacteroides sp.]